jgi:formylglycine-generating enzyme
MAPCSLTLNPPRVFPSSLGAPGLLLALACQFAQAQQGVVVDKATGKPIAKAYVMHRPTWTLVMTNAQGAFTFPDVLPVKRGREGMQAFDPVRLTPEGRLHWGGPGDPGPARLVEANGKTHTIPGNLERGYSLPTLRTGLYVLLWGQAVYRMVWMDGQAPLLQKLGSVSASSSLNPLARQAALAESLIVSRYGYDAITVLVSGKDVGQVQLTPNAKAPPPGMRALKGGLFKMGNNKDAVASPIHDVTVSGFYVDTTEVTQADYELLMGEKPWTRDANGYDLTSGPRHSALQMIWYEAALYCNKRSKRDGLDTVFKYSGISSESENGFFILNELKTDIHANGYRLPTEAEWEYACKGGQDSIYHWGTNKDIQDSANVYGWNNKNTFNNGNSITNNPVAAKKPNQYDLYDMGGNAAEYVLDTRISPYPLTPNVDPFFEEQNSAPHRQAKGGGFDFRSDAMSCSARGYLLPYTYGTNSGFRVVLPIR